MSFVIKHIQMTLDPESIENAIKQIETIQKLLHPAMMEYIRQLAEQGVTIARAELLAFPKPAYDEGQLWDSIRHEMNENGAVITAGEGLESGYPNTSYAMFVEHGTGIFGADLNDHGWKGWTYFNPRIGKFVHTTGMFPRPFMHNTFEDLIDEAKTHGGQVIAEYLRDNS